MANIGLQSSEVQQMISTVLRLNMPPSEKVTADFVDRIGMAVAQAIEANNEAITKKLKSAGLDF